MQYLGNLGSGEPVYDRSRSHLHAGVVERLPAAFAKVNARLQGFLVTTVDFGRPVGETICVATVAGDEIVYAQRPGRFGLSRFVKNRQPEPASAVTLVLKKDGREDYYVLITAFVGAQAPPEPWDRNANEQSVAFWSDHALVWGAEEVTEGTEQSDCPW